jgi:hypothetical protein
MKIRSGFVANSSSSSFMVALPTNLKPTAKNLQEFFFSAWTVAEKEDYADAYNLYLSDQLRGGPDASVEEVFTNVTRDLVKLFSSGSKKPLEIGGFKVYSFLADEIDLNAPHLLDFETVCARVPFVENYTD